MFLRNMRNLMLVMGVPMTFVLIYSNFVQRPRRDPIHFVGSGDPEIAAARDKARATLPEFLEHLKNPAADESHFGVKFRLSSDNVLTEPRPVDSDADADEFIWANRISVSGDGTTLLGFIDDTPRKKGYFSGEPVSIPMDGVTDWGYKKAGVVQGFFSTRAMLDRLAPAEAAEAKAAMGWN